MHLYRYIDLNTKFINQRYYRKCNPHSILNHFFLLCLEAFSTRVNLSFNIPLYSIDNCIPKPKLHVSFACMTPEIGQQ